MGREPDFPRRSLGSRFTGRAILIALGLIVFVVVVFGRAIAQFYVDALWHDALGRGDVFWGQISAKLTLFVVFFSVFIAIAILNLWVADRAAPDVFSANVHPYVERFHEVFGHRLRLVRYGTAVVLGFVLALPAVSQWQQWLLFRNSKSFGVSDPLFGADVGFYVFELPFIMFAIDWLFAALVITLILTLAAHLLNGGVLFTSSTPTVRNPTKVHVAVLLAVLAAVKAADYWFSRYELTNDTRGFVQGATYTAVNAQLPALMLLVLVALLTAVLFLSTIRTNRWRYPIVASGLWLVVLIVGGLIYPALVQSLVVRPNQEQREAIYIERNIDATRSAMNIGEVEVEEIDFERLAVGDIESDIAPLQNVRLLSPTEMKARFEFDEGEVAGLQVDDLDVDRYEVDGSMQQVLVTARELDLDGLPSNSWQARHLVYTRGCGLVLAPVSHVTGSFRPDYRDIELERPELYFSPATGGYALARTDAVESDCGAPREYTGTSGVRMSSFVRRASFALAFFDYNVLGSSSINSDSQMLWIRDVRDRAEKLAPFLSFDSDPYPVVVDGSVQWVIDAYTTSANYPYAQRVGTVEPGVTDLSSGDNYVRNSVKTVVDAYTGDVTFYVVDDDDPILRAWRTAFPDLFTSGSTMPDEIREHLRYPEDMFRLQTNLYSKYQIEAPDFFERRGAWSVAQAPSTSPGDPAGSGGQTVDPEEETSEFATESSAGRFIPYYTMFRNPVTGEFEFVLLRPYVPFSVDDRRTELKAYMTASSDPETYGRLITYVLPDDDLPDGPLRVVSEAESSSDLSERIDRDDNPTNNSRVRFGDLQIVPIADGLVWVRPYYVSIEGSDSTQPSTEYRYVIVSHNAQSAFGRTLQEALAVVFPGFDIDIGDRRTDVADEPVPELIDDASDDEPTETTVPPDDRPPLDDDATAADLLAEANALFEDADAYLRDGDLAGYQAAIEQASALVEQAIELLGE